MKNTFEAFFNQKLIFSSNSHWLHPIFEFEEFLRDNPYETLHIEIHDKIIGKAAALLLVRLGIRKVHALMLSSLGESVFRKFHITYSHDEKIEKIFCKTEELLGDEWDPEKAYAILRKRAGL